MSRQDAGELPLHMAVRQADRSSLPLVDFIIQNGCIPECSRCSLPLSLTGGTSRMLILKP